jgi:hypothetical protein
LRCAAIGLLAATLLPGAAMAYRSFDSTDGDGRFGRGEIEASPVSFRHDDGGPVWIAPAARFNYGSQIELHEVLPGWATTAADNSFRILKVQSSRFEKSGAVTEMAYAITAMPGACGLIVRV